MKSLKNSVSNYWDRIAGSYSDYWHSGAMNWSNLRERKIITEVLGLKKKSSLCLDVGSGNGRIIDFLLELGFKNIDGRDISQEMVLYLRDKYRGNPRINSLEEIKSINEISGKYSVITAIRVLKYNKNWKDNLNHLVDLLEPQGTVVFTIPNPISTASFAKFAMPVYKANISQLREILGNLPLNDIKIVSVFRLPDFLHKSGILSKLKIVPLCEKILEKILPKTFLGKIFFVVASKS